MSWLDEPPCNVSKDCDPSAVATWSNFSVSTLPATGAAMDSQTALPVSASQVLPSSCRRYGAPQHVLSSNTMALITSDCGEHQLGLIASVCVPQ